MVYSNKISGTFLSLLPNKYAYEIGNSKNFIT